MNDKNSTNVKVRTNVKKYTYAQRDTNDMYANIRNMKKYMNVKKDTN